VPVQGDPARLQQTQVNLLMNAAKYTPDGGEVWYTLGIEEGEAVIRVRDTGVGMPADLISRAFDLFVQADRTLDRADGGIGVGLTLVRAIVEQHGGKVSAFSQGTGQGSEFVVRLPLATTPGTSTRSSASAVPPGQTLRVLIVEDDADNRTSLQSLLQLDGHDVWAVGSGMEALQAIETQMPDVAIVDIGLPGMSGYELARVLRRTYPLHRLRLIALTGYGQLLDKVAAQTAGFDHHLTKPLNPQELERLLRGRESGT
jgi:CheY-like chemotaxis protein